MATMVLDSQIVPETLGHFWKFSTIQKNILDTIFCMDTEDCLTANFALEN